MYPSPLWTLFLFLHQGLYGFKAVGASLFYGRQYGTAAGEKIVLRAVQNRQVEPGAEILEFLERIAAAVHLEGAPVLIDGAVKRRRPGGEIGRKAHNRIHEDRPGLYETFMDILILRGARPVIDP
jgi:hypothetical protein